MNKPWTQSRLRPDAVQTGSSNMQAHGTCNAQNGEHCAQREGAPSVATHRNQVPGARIQNFADDHSLSHSSHQCVVPVIAGLQACILCHGSCCCRLQICTKPGFAHHVALLRLASHRCAATIPSAKHCGLKGRLHAGCLNMSPRPGPCLICSMVIRQDIKCMLSWLACVSAPLALPQSTIAFSNVPDAAEVCNPPQPGPLQLDA